MVVLTFDDASRETIDRLQATINVGRVQLADSYATVEKQKVQLAEAAKAANNQERLIKRLRETINVGRAQLADSDATAEKQRRVIDELDKSIKGLCEEISQLRAKRHQLPSWRLFRAGSLLHRDNNHRGG